MRKLFLGRDVAKLLSATRQTVKEMKEFYLIMQDCHSSTDEVYMEETRFFRELENVLKSHRESLSKVHLDFSRAKLLYTLQYDNLESVYRQIAVVPGLREFSLQHFGFYVRNERQLQNITEIVLKCTTLTHLDLGLGLAGFQSAQENKNALTTETCVRFFFSLSKLFNLRSLKLDLQGWGDFNCQINQDCLQTLCQSLAKLRRLEHLEINLSR